WLWRENLDRLPADTTVVASDLSHGMVKTAKEALGDDERFAFIAGDVQAIAFPESTFDVVVANHMLYHVPDLDLGLSEVTRVLRRGGFLLAATNGERHMAELREALGDVSPYIKAFGLESGPPRVAEHFDDVAVERRPDILQVTDAEAVVAYVASMSTIREIDLAEMRTRVEEAIRADGSFPIHTDAGVITAVKG
ncbi:MAG: class I SAM-dependent methyltransferase, partial [Actinomycetota bacterium]